VQDTDDNMAQADFMLDTEGYKHTLTICNTCCISPVTMIARTHLNVTFYVHYLSFCLIWRVINGCKWHPIFIYIICALTLIQFKTTGCSVAQSLLLNPVSGVNCSKKHIRIVIFNKYFN